MDKNNSENKDAGSNSRSVERITDSYSTVEGEGFLVHRSFPSKSINFIDPFLLLDEMGPSNLKPGEARGAPDHPHRGFETVTYMLKGEFEHRDSAGNGGKIGPGDVQWMTAGSGIIHSEMPSKDFAAMGGEMHGFQLWVNLPRHLKMSKPRYQDILAENIPRLNLPQNAGKVRIIAGKAYGIESNIDIHIQIVYLHYELTDGANAVADIEGNLNAFAYVINGSGRFGKNALLARQGQVVIFANDGSKIEFHASENSTLEFLVIAGKPINEPVVRYGPFVMNSQEEIYRAISDYQSGKMRSIQ